MKDIEDIDDIVRMYEAAQAREREMITKALSHRLSMLDIDEFIEVTGIKLNNILPTGMMWDSFCKNIPIYITDDLVKIFGYSGELYTQKLGLMKLIKKYSIPIIQLDNNRYEKFLSSSKARQNGLSEEKEHKLPFYYPDLDRSNGKGKTKHNLIMPRDLKKLMLVVNTSNGDLVREYVISLDELFQLYLSYQKIHEHEMRRLIEHHFKEEKERHEATMQKLDEMKESLDVTEEVVHELNHKINKATDERAPRTQSAATQEKFIILKLNNFNYPWQYYAIRCQNTTIKRSIRKVKLAHPSAQVLIEISYQPNSKNFHNLLRERLQNQLGHITIRRNDIRLGEGYSEAQFIEAVRNLDDSKKDIEYEEEE